jgi:hypothetical protein
MKKNILLVSGLGFLLQVLPVVAAPQSQTKSFSQWCVQKKYVHEAAKITIEALLKEAGADNCYLAESKLKSLTRLDFSQLGVGDLKGIIFKIEPYGKLIDLRPLAGFTNLTDLNLYRNQIHDLQPLQGLSNLTNLNLSGNQIGDLKPLSGLSKLINLYLDGNQISDVKSLAGLSNLKWLDLQRNKISEKVCPVKPESICKF